MQDQRAGLAELAELQTLLHQLWAARKIPTTLRDLVAEKDYGSAVLLYSNAQVLLQAHGHIGLLRPISREAREIMQARYVKIASFWKNAVDCQNFEFRSYPMRRHAKRNILVDQHHVTSTVLSTAWLSGKAILVMCT